ncbi:MAG: hypothetical protein IJG60_07065 [Thermoguttaceae bacterium]|nr:hypothetical protein [Thermoguttaceae bacterium]
MSGIIEPTTETTNVRVEMASAASFSDTGLVLSNELLSKIGASPKVPPRVIVDGDRIVVVNSVRYAIEKCRRTMKGEAERLGCKTDEDVFELLSKWRHEEE